MKVMLPIVKDCDGDIKLAKSFHNAQNVCIYDCKNDLYEWISINKINADAGSFSFIIKQRKIKSVISCTIHPLVLKIFSENGLEVYKAEGNNLQQNISFFQNKKLNSFSGEDTNQLMGCGSSCNSCSTNCN
jgi:predicted Fe-Mo cluster-binding NifX family protein